MKAKVVIINISIKQVILIALVEKTIIEEINYIFV